MKFTASVLALLAITTGALASPAPHRVANPPNPPKPVKPVKPVKPIKQTNNCGRDQALYCCYTTEKSSAVSCAAFSNGGIGGICNGIQMCCNNQGSGSGSQSCGFNVGGGTITFSPSVGGGGIPLE
ncbi:hypothetical protein ACHAPA_007879 [Fusarium lateritium]